MRPRHLAVLPLMLACSAAPPAPIPPVSTPPGPSVAEVPRAAPAPPALRLPHVASPVRYAVELTLEPKKPTFEGKVSVELDVAEATSLLWLNGSALTVTAASFETAAGKRVSAEAVKGGDDFIGFAFAEPIPVGRGHLEVSYLGVVSDKDDHGIFAEDEQGERYLFTQFESTSARRAFPCFDEPSYKVPWQVTLRVPEGLTALSNTPVLREAHAAPGASPWKTVTFAETKPLPAYLVAFAVGPFDLVDAGAAGRNGTRVRIAVPKGQASQAALAATTAPATITRLEELLGIPYPYEKLDVVAVPRLVTFGAMENAGLITFTRFGLLAKPEEQTHAFEMRLTGTMVHELGHHWFGDLVTTAWWDDIWLNEAFASWIEARIITPWKPAWRYDVARMRSTGRAMQSDAAGSVRRIREPITSNDDILNAFDDITYSKGAAVIGMFEAYLGKEAFMKGLRRYLTEHAHRTATAADLLAALSAESGQDIGPAFSSFLDQPGVPLVAADLACDPARRPFVGLAQRRYWPLGSGARSGASWRIPVCVRYGVASGEAKACTMLGPDTQTLELPDAKGCPAWIEPNAEGAGYYHSTYRLRNVDALLQGKGKLSVLERVALARDLGALVATADGGDLTIAHAFERVPALLRDPSPGALRAAIELVSGVRDVMLAPEERPAFARFVERTFGARARSMTWRAKPNEDEDLRLLRPTLLTLVADRGADEKLGEEAGELAARWLDDPKAIEEDIVDAVLAVAAERGGRPLFERLRAEAKKSKDDVRRRHALGAMARFRDPVIVKESLAMLLGHEHDIRDELGLLWQDARMADVTFAFVRENFDALLARLPDEMHGQLPSLGDAFCDEPHRAAVEAFFGDRVARLPGGPRNLARALDRIKLCSALKSAEELSLHEFLAKR